MGERKSFPDRFLTYRLKWLAIWGTVDVVLLFAAYLIAFTGRGATASLDYTRGITFAGLSACITLVILYVSGVYHRIWSHTSGHGLVVILRAMLVSAAVVTFCNLSLTPRPLPLSVVYTAHVLGLIGLVAVRYRSRLITGLGWRWKAVWNYEFPSARTRVLIVGAGEAGHIVASWLKYHNPATTPYCIVGFVDDNPTKRGMYVENCPVFGSCAEIPELVLEHKIDLIVFAIHHISGAGFRRILSYCESTSARVKVIPDIFAAIDANHGAPPLRDLVPEDILGRPSIMGQQAVDTQAVAGKVVLVTGAAGSIGSELSRQMLTYNPVRLILLDNNESGLHDLFTGLEDETHQGVLIPALVDITNPDALRAVFETHRPQVVFHSAAYKHVPMLEHYPREAVRVNVGGTYQLASLAREYGVERFVLISTDKAVNPTGVMGASKRLCERLIHSLARQNGHHTLFTAVRFGNVFGSRGSVVPTFNRQIDRGGPVTITDPEMTRYFMTVSEAVNLVIQAACLTHGGDLFMLKMGDDVRIVELAERLIRMRGLRPYHDIPIHFTGVRPGEKLHEELHSLSEQTLPTLHPHIVQLEGCENDLDGSPFLRQLDTLLDGYSARDLRPYLLDLANNRLIEIERSVPQPPAVDQSTLGLTPMNIPMSSPDINQADIDAVNEVLTTRWLSLGPKLDQFEAAFSHYVGTEHAIALNSGTSGLHLAMIAMGLQPGDEVITTSFSFIASANCVLYERAKPVFVDIDPLTGNLDPAAIEAAITERTRAILAVHVFGQPADMDPILAIARKYNLTVIEDACEAIGAEYKSVRAGRLADAAVFAFYPNKQMTTGEGGMVVTDRSDWKDYFYSLRNQGRDTFDTWLSHSRLGFNYRMDEMSAALGLSQLQRIDTLLAKRARVAGWYNERLQDLPGIQIPYIAPTTTRMSWFVYVVRCTDGVDRNAMMEFLRTQNVPSKPYFTPIHLQPFYQNELGWRRGDLPHTEWAGDVSLALPFSSVMTEAQVEYVCEQVRVGVTQSQLLSV